MRFKLLGSDALLHSAYRPRRDACVSISSSQLTQINPHFAECFQDNSVPKLTAARIACTTESQSADISLSSR
jgi:hypothetical protein